MNSLGFDKLPGETRVVVAMSGGVDSSVTAMLLRNEGYEVIGVTMQLFDDASPSSWGDAKRVADALGMPHHLVHFEREFSQEVMDYFADTYLRGETPIPCVVCNKRIKFGELMKAAKDLGADALATGHYVRRVIGKNGPELHKALDDSRDQSYFLYALSKEQLDFLRFPLGEMKKTEVRNIAEQNNLPVAAKPDSQDICFIPEGAYAQVVERLRPGAIKPGDIVDMNGSVLGKHHGIIHFTVGQRRGLNINDREGENNDPLYVIKLDAKKNRVIVGPREALVQSKVILRDMNWLADEVPADGIEVYVRLRSPQTPISARFKMKPNREGEITLTTPAYGVAPGQAGVIYDGDRVLGGGWIVGS